jgi:hypothetical protein
MIRGVAVAYAMDEGASTERSLTDAEIAEVLKLVRPAFEQGGGTA